MKKRKTDLPEWAEKLLEMYDSQSPEKTKRD